MNRPVITGKSYALWNVNVIALSLSLITFINVLENVTKQLPQISLFALNQTASDVFFFKFESVH